MLAQFTEKSYFCTRLTYGIAELFHEKGLVPRCVDCSAYH